MRSRYWSGPQWTICWPRSVTTGQPWSVGASGGAAVSSVAVSSATVSSATGRSDPHVVGLVASSVGERQPGAAAPLVPPPGDLAIVDLLVEGEDGVDQRLGPGRASWRVHVDGHDLVDALDDGVVVEHAAATGAHAHGDDPLGLHHLVVDLTEHRRHLLADAAGDDHEVGLARGAAEHLHAEPGQVEVGGAGAQDRKSTRLNSSHVSISYAV